MLRMRRHSILSAPGVFQMENRFSRDLSPEFFGFKKFLTKTLFLFRHSMPLKSEMVWVPLCSTLKPLLLWVTQITLFSIPFLFVTSMKIGSVNRIDKKPLRRLFIFFFFLAALKARHPSLWWCFATILRPALIRWTDTKHLVAWITIKRIAALIHSF